MEKTTIQYNVDTVLLHSSVVYSFRSIDEK